MVSKAELRVFGWVWACVFAMALGAVAQQPGDNHPRDESGVPRAGVNGFTVPRCLYCPQPQYSKEALKKNFSGVVLLEVTITTDGKVINPIVLKDPGLGLKEKALAELQNWKMKPALNPEGKPVNCRLQIEIAFHRNRNH